jgi:hypothetical protein
MARVGRVLARRHRESLLARHRRRSRGRARRAWGCGADRPPDRALRGS